MLNKEKLEQEYTELRNRLERAHGYAYACREVRRWIRKGLSEINPDVDEPEYEIANNILADIQNDIEYYEKLRQEALDKITEFGKKAVDHNDA